MLKAGKHVAKQSLLPWGEACYKHGLVSGTIDVFDSKTDKVSQQWLSDCKESRVLTQDLLKEISSVGNLVAALRQVVKNGGVGGVDGMSLSELKSWFSTHYQELNLDIQQGHYIPSPVLRVQIPKSSGGYRQLGIPTVKDRLVQQAIHQVLMRYYEGVFSDYSYGFRPNRNAHQALGHAGHYVSEGYRYVVDLDLENFFDRVNHDRLMWILSTRIGDKSLLKLIHRFLRSGMLSSGIVSQRIQGTPQGSPLSPLLSNIVLDELDKELSRRGHRFVRYADDLVIFVKSMKSAERVSTSITLFIEEVMLLKVNRSKSRICRPYALNFLGYSILNDGSLGLSKTSESRFKDKIRKLSQRKRGISMPQLISELNCLLRGWLNYFKLARMRKRLRGLSSWLRHRLRCFRLKQCKRAIGIFRFLVKQGLAEWQAWILALSGKGWYRKSGCPQAHQAMNQQWFDEIGLFNLEENYCYQFKGTAVYVSTHSGVRGR